MSAIAEATGRISMEEYLAGELRSEVRHEYVDGVVYAMAGASAEHNRIAGNIFGELRQRLRGTKCEPFINDMKLKAPISTGDIFYYPDVMVVCDPSDNAKYYRERPAVVIEVISPETERTDRREKAIAYGLIPSVQAYVMVEQTEIRATILRRAQPQWTTEVIAGRDAVLKLPIIGIDIPLARVYERTGMVA